MSGNALAADDKTPNTGLCSRCSHWDQGMPAASQMVLNALLQSVRELHEANRHLLAKIEQIGEAINEIAAAKPMPAGKQIIRNGGMVINVQSRFATLDGQELNLTSSEFDVLAKLVSSAPAVVSVAELAAALGYQPVRLAGDISQWHIHNLRKKVGRKRIRTVYGQGYVWVG